MAKGKDRRPDWVPEDAGEEFTTRMLPGDKAKPGSAAKDFCIPAPAARRRQPSVDEYVQGVLCGDRTMLGRAITLVESNAPAHLELAQKMLTKLMPSTGRSLRLGITGYPGAGKSTLIDALGDHLCQQGKRVAVLAVDPSSSLSKGSILGDKTRMERLSRRPEAFIRPSPSGGMLGGVARKSRETILVCEAAGFEVILVETVGVGQSEVMVRSMVDFFLLVMIAGAGDELQGIKRGIMELADTILVNKADGEGRSRALAAKAEFEQVLPYLQPATKGWQTKALASSALTGQGIGELWDTVEEFARQTKDSGEFEKRRQSQNIQWVRSLVSDHLLASFNCHPQVKKLLPQLEREVSQGETSPTQAALKLLEVFGQKI